MEYTIILCKIVSFCHKNQIGVAARSISRATIAAVVSDPNNCMSLHGGQGFDKRLLRVRAAIAGFPPRTPLLPRVRPLIGTLAILVPAACACRLRRLRSRPYCSRALGSPGRRRGILRHGGTDCAASIGRKTCLVRPLRARRRPARTDREQLRWYGVRSAEEVLRENNRYGAHAFSCLLF